MNEEKLLDLQFQISVLKLHRIDQAARIKKMQEEIKRLKEINDINSRRLNTAGLFKSI